MEVIASLVDPPMELTPTVKRPRGKAEAEEPAKRQRTDDGLIVVKAVREYLKGIPTPVNCSAEALVAINMRLQCILLEAVGRTYDNGRKTLKACDL